MLIARAFPVMHVYTKPRGGQKAYKGHVITLPQDVQQLADVLPRCPKDLPVIVFTVVGKNNNSKDFIVRRQKVAQALYWLTGLNETGEPNNHLYQNVTINHNALESLPENGVLNTVTTVDLNNDHTEGQEVVTDLGPSNLDDDKVYDENSEMSSFLPTNINKRKEKDIIHDQFLDQTKKHEWHIGNEPLNEFTVPFLATMCFPTLFPDGKGDPTNNAILSDTGTNFTDAFASKLKHLIKFSERINDKWFYRFAAHPRFAYWAYKILYRRRIIGQGSYFLKQNPSEANLTLDNLKEMLLSNSYNSLMSKLMHYGKNVSGTNAYWSQARDDLKAIIHQKGPPTIFWTLSCADFHWPEFHHLLGGDGDIGNTERRENVINNPHLLDWLFTERTEKFVKYWLKESLGATWHWFRYEYAVQRGSIHCHGVAKLENDPNLCELSEKVVKGYVTAKSLKLSHNLSEDDLSKKQLIIKEGQDAETVICQYVDSILTTVNPCNPDDEHWEKPSTHPCKKKFDDISKSEWDKDYVDLVNLVQRRSQCSSAYCLCKKGEDENLSCRFNYPKDLNEKTHLEFEEIRSKGGTLHYRVKVNTKRNDTRVNNHQ